jgi:hypothetical protein
MFAELPQKRDGGFFVSITFRYRMWPCYSYTDRPAVYRMVEVLLFCFQRTVFNKGIRFI